MFTSFAFAVLLLAGPAQTEPNTPGQQRAANRRALREARATEAAYKDSHLAVSARQLKRGESAPIQGAADEPRFGRDGRPHATEPKYPSLRLRKSKKTPPAN